MDRDYDAFASASHCKDVVAPVHPSQCPTAPLNSLRKLAPGDLLHTVTSSTRSAASAWVCAFLGQLPSVATDRGSRRFFLRHRFLGDNDFWKLHNFHRRSLLVLTEGRFEHQFSVSDLA